LPHNDIALVQVNRKFEYSKKVQQINFSKNEIPEDAILTLTGYGATGTDRDDYGILRTVNLKRISLKECNKPKNPLLFGDGHLCTFNDLAEQGICYGDR
jgi:hypothetical protein